MTDFDSRALRSSSERTAGTASGYLMLVIAFLALMGIVLCATQIETHLAFAAGLVACVIAFTFVAIGFYLLQPNQAAAILQTQRPGGVDGRAAQRLLRCQAEVGAGQRHGQPQRLQG